MIFWLVEITFFLPFSDSPATDIFIFLSSGNLFLNEYCFAVSGNGFSGQWKPFFIYFSDIHASDSSFSSSGKVLLKRILYSGQWTRIFCLVKTIFPPIFYHKSIIPAGGIKIFVQWKQHYFIYSFFFCLRKPYLAPNPFPLARMSDFLEEHIFTTRKMTGVRSLAKIER